jgi:hypothetical protein
MKFNKWLLMAAAGVFFIASCEKEDPDNVNKVDITGKNNQEVMMIQPWAFYAYSQTMNNNTVDAMDACQKDDIFVFKANDICDVRTSAVKCYDGEPDTYETGWSMPSATGDVVNFFGFDFILKTKTNTSVVLGREWENRTGEWVYEKLELRAAK